MGKPCEGFVSVPGYLQITFARFSLRRYNMDTTNDGFFSVVLKGQTYLNILYLLLAFPLGLGYFIVLVTGLSLGFSLAILWIGLLILALMVVVWWGMAAVERQLAIWLLRE